MADRVHIQLDDELEKLTALVTRMGGLVEQQISDALDALADRNSSQAENAIARDEAVNDLQLEIDNSAAMALTLRHPVARDLREVVATIKLATNLERMGDLAKNIAKRALILNKERPVKLIGGLVRMGHLALAQTRQVLDAYAAHELDRAMDVWSHDEEIDDLYNSLFREFLTYMIEDPRTIGLCAHLLFIAKNLERIGDHATNIAEIIYYVEKAEHVSVVRPKGASSQPVQISPGANGNPSDD